MLGGVGAAGSDARGYPIYPASLSYSFEIGIFNSIAFSITFDAPVEMTLLFNLIATNSPSDNSNTMSATFVLVSLPR